MKKIAFVRPPINSFYNDLDVREDNLITYFLGFCETNKLDFRYKVFDFTLEKTTSIQDIGEYEADYYVISVRETGSTPHYAVRIANYLLNIDRNVVLYGQVARFKLHPIFKDKEIEFVEHDESRLANFIFPEITLNQEVNFYSGYFPKPYFTELKISQERQKRFRAALETTRGCEYNCAFCYINYGQNHSQKWLVRSNNSILDDIQTYYNLGVKIFVFMDSEFLGTDENLHKTRELLLKKIKENFPDIQYMIYCRANSLTQFDNNELLKSSGLVNVFIGVESFFDKDLKSIRKGVTEKILVKSIKDLMRNKIYMTLSFITFNKNTTIESLRHNILVLKELFKDKNRHYLGMPNFAYNFESSWDGSGTYELSRKTYIRWTVFYKEQPGTSKVVFDTKFEPLMEIYRILHYEITKKIAQLNYEMDKKENLNAIDLWFYNIGAFSLGAMENFLDEFERGLLTLDNLNEQINKLYKYISYYNQQLLPTEIQDLQTQDETLSSYSTYEVGYLDHGWDKQIPVSPEMQLQFI